MKEPSFYIYLQYKIQEHSRAGVISMDEVMELLGKYRIPKKLKRVVIAELSEMKLVKVLNIPKAVKVSVTNCKMGNEYELMSRLTRRNKYVESLT